MGERKMLPISNQKVILLCPRLTISLYTNKLMDDLPQVLEMTPFFTTFIWGMVEGLAMKIGAEI